MASQGTVGSQLPARTPSSKQASKQASQQPPDTGHLSFTGHLSLEEKVERGLKEDGQGKAKVKATWKYKARQERQGKVQHMADKEA